MTRSTNRAVVAYTHRAADVLGEVVTELTHGVLQRMADAEGGIASNWPAGSGGSPTTYADPTATAALRGGDLATLHRVELERQLRRAMTSIERVRAICALYPEAGPVTEAGRAALARTNSAAAKSCESCARTHRPDGAVRWSPIRSTLLGPTTVAGRLDHPVVLCSWCYDRVAEWGRLPTPAEVERHHEGRRVAWPADVPRPEASA